MSEINPKCSWCGKFTKEEHLLWINKWNEPEQEHYPVCKKCHDKDILHINQLNHDSHINHKELTCQK